MNDPSDWCYICGLVSARAERLMDKRAVLGVFEADSPEELKSRLRASLLFADAPPSDMPMDEVNKRFQQAVRGIAVSSPDVRIGDLFILDRVWEGFRAFAKSTPAEKGAVQSGRRTESADVTAELFRACWEGRVEDERMQPVADAAVALRAAAEGETDLAGMVDRVVDAHEAAAHEKTAHALGGEALEEWVAVLTRLRAGLTLFRAKRLGWDTQKFLEPWRAVGVDHPALADLATGKKEEWAGAWDRLGLPNAAGALNAADAPVELERRIDNRISGLAGGAKGMPFGTERVFAFLWALRNEATNLRMVLTAAACGIPAERVAAQMRAAG